MVRFFTLVVVLIWRGSQLLAQCPEPVTYVDPEGSTATRQIVKAVSQVEGEGYVHRWYTTPTGTAAVFPKTEHNRDGLLITTLAVTRTSIYWVATESAGCQSRRVSITVSVAGSKATAEEEKITEDPKETAGIRIKEPTAIPVGLHHPGKTRPLAKSYGDAPIDQIPVLTEDLEDLLGVRRIYTWPGYNPPTGGGIHELIHRGLYSAPYKVSGTYTGCNGTLSKIKFMGLSVPIEYTLQGGGTYCKGEQGAPVELAGSQPGIVYRLYKDGAFAGQVKIGNGQALSFGVQEEEGTYTVMGADPESGCDVQMTGEAEVKEITPPEVEAGPNTTMFAQHALVPLEGMGPAGGEWEGPGTSSIHINPEAAGIGTHTLTYEYTDPYGCSNSDSRAITVVARPVLEVEGNTTLKEGESATLSVQAGYEIYRWYKDDKEINNQHTPSLTVTEAGIYQGEVEEGGAKAITESIKISAGTAPSTNQNYVSSRTVQIPGITETEELQHLNISEATLEVQYMDGLGRPMQTVAVQASPQQRDIISPMIYDRFGRDSIAYLPYVSHSPYGDYQQTAIADQQNFYNSADNNIATDAYPYAIKVLENSPLNRLLEQGAPGEVWQPYKDHDDSRTVKFAYGTNKENEVKLFDLDQEGRPATEGPYAPNQLSVNTTKDEHDNKVKEYTDKLGRVILKRVYLTETETLDTYYIYDDFGNLRVVLPPQANKLYDQYYPTDKDKFLDNWAFQYRYDARKRMIEKKVPGAGRVYMVYDQRDRLVLTQDANQREEGRWIFTKYDHFNRPVMTGKWEDKEKRSREELQQVLNEQIGKDHTYTWYESRAAEGLLGYDNQSFPKDITEADLLSITYYDYYDFIQENTTLWGDRYEYQQQAEPYKNTPMPMVKGQVTGTMTKILDTDQWIQSVSYYDNKYRMIQGISSNHLKGIDRTDTQYDFVGKVLRTRNTHHLPGRTDKIIEEHYSYDHVGRIMDQYHEISIGAQFENLTGADTTGNTITKTNASGWNAGAQIENQYIPEENNGFITARIKNNSGSFAIGLTEKYTSPHYTSMDYALVQETNVVFIWEKGSKLPTPHHVKAGDIVKVERNNEQISYKLNDKTIYSSHGQSTEALLGAIAIKIQHLTIEEVAMSSSGEVLLTKNEYNEIGELIDKKLHSEDKGKSHKQSLDYHYNIRGWLKTINDPDLNSQEAEQNSNPDLFGMELVYNEQQEINNTPQYNGNISGMKWSVNLGLDDLTERAYAYTYDGINRIKTAQGGKKYEVGGMIYDGSFDVHGIDYDFNGNILFLSRKDGKGEQLDAMDNGYGEGISMSNKLIKVDDEGNKEKGFKDGVQEAEEYLYDGNGNMITDRNKGIEQIWYNHLNLPKHLSMGAQKAIIYTYDAAGIKLRKEVHHGDTLKTTDYIGPYVYEDGKLQFIQTPEGRIVFSDCQGHACGTVTSDQEGLTTDHRPLTTTYEYHMKDHLGNVRMTFTSKPRTETITATLEEERKQEDQAIFSPSYDEVKRINSKIFNHTEGEESTYSIRLSGAEGEIAGLAKSKAVMPGDTIEMEVYGKYTKPTTQPSNISQLLAFSLTGAFGLAATATGELALAYQSVNELFNAGAIITQGDWEEDQAPKAYLNYILFDKDYKAYDMGFDQIDREALEAGSDTPHDKMYLKALVTQPGYIYIYLSNENPTLVDVYFDDLTIQHHHSPVIQMEDYYPFGMVAESARNEERGMKNDFLYNGKELQSDLDLDWYDYGARMYDGSLGRWYSIDPMASKFPNWSPYTYTFNNPILFVDPDGEEPTRAALEKAAKDLGTSVAAIRAVYKVETDGSAFRANGDAKILFERHYFSKLTGGKYDKTNSDISNKVQGGYGKYSEQLTKLEKAKKLDKDAALKSVSYGGFQIMGTNFKSAGFDSVEKFAEAMMSKDEDKHLNAFVNFVSNNSKMLKALKDGDWAAFAKLYNGPKYAKNKYDTKLKTAYESYLKEEKANEDKAKEEKEEEGKSE